MKRLFIIAGLGALTLATAAAAHDTTIPYPNRGACEAASAHTSQDEVDWLLVIGAQYFDTVGDVNSFLTKAWTCDLNPSDGQYYMTDHVQETLDSEWFQRRNH